MEMKERKAVERELRQLLETTIRLEGELNSAVTPNRN